MPLQSSTHLADGIRTAPRTFKVEADSQKLIPTVTCAPPILRPANLHGRLLLLQESGGRKPRASGDTSTRHITCVAVVNRHASYTVPHPRQHTLGHLGSPGSRGIERSHRESGGARFHQSAGHPGIFERAQSLRVCGSVCDSRSWTIQSCSVTATCPSSAQADF
jgi:hypothetical protein